MYTRVVDGCGISGESYKTVWNINSTKTFKGYLVPMAHRRVIQLFTWKLLLTVETH